MKRIASVLMLVAIGAGNASAMPKDGCGGDCSSCHKLTVAEANGLMKALGGKVTQVKVPTVRGLWEIDLEKDGKKVVAYLDYGKKHLIPGPIYDLTTRQPIAGGGAPAPKLTKVNVASIPTDNTLIMGNPKGKKRLYVFTDPECPFCIKLHAELKKLVAQNSDVAIFVKLFPLKIHPNSYAKAVTILQSGSLKLLDEAFAGGKLPAPAPAGTPNGIDETIKAAQALGVNATPTLVFPDGSVNAGFLDVAQIQKRLSADRKK